MMHIFTRLLAAISVIVFAEMAVAQAEYRVQPGDTLIVEVLEDATLNRSVVVLPDGRFNFPFAGSVPAQGRTVIQIQAAIAAGIASNYATTPTVFVSARPLERLSTAPTVPVDTTERINVYFLGEVASPGLREVELGTTFLQAMAQSGGFTQFAATKRVQLRRTDGSGAQKVLSFNYKAISNGAVLTQDPALRDGDIILVPERRLFE